MDHKALVYFISRYQCDPERSYALAPLGVGPLNKWKLIHSYNRIVEANLAEPVVCPDDNQTLISMIDTVDDKNEDPVMWCPACDSRYHLGINAWDQIGAVVRDLWDPRWQTQ